VTTGVKDSAGNTLSSQYETSSGFIVSWTKQLGTGADDSASGVAVDSSNNVYVTGHTKGALDGNTSSGGYDIFLVKYNSSGSKQWTKQFGTSSVDYARGVAVDSSGNVYVTGEFASGPRSNIFLVKYNSSGIKQWTQQLGANGPDSGRGVTVDSLDNIYITGSTKGGLDGNTNSGSYDIFLVKYNSSGSIQWSTLYGNADVDQGHGVVTDSSNNIYITGQLTNSLGLIKYDSSGIRQWTIDYRQAGYYGRGVAVDSSDNIYLTGSGFTNAEDYILAKYNSSGSQQWFRRLTMPDSVEVGRGVAVDSSNNVYVTGYTNGALDGNTSSGSYDIFLVKYNSSGSIQWTKQFGTSSVDYGLGVTVDSSDNIYVIGFTSGGLDGNTNSGNSDDIFLVKYNSSGNRL